MITFEIYLHAGLCIIIRIAGFTLYACHFDNLVHYILDIDAGP